MTAGVEPTLGQARNGRAQPLAESQGCPSAPQLGGSKWHCVCQLEVSDEGSVPELGQPCRKNQAERMSHALRAQPMAKQFCPSQPTFFFPFYLQTEE